MKNQPFASMKANTYMVGRALPAAGVSTGEEPSFPTCWRFGKSPYVGDTRRFSCWRAVSMLRQGASCARGCISCRAGSATRRWASTSKALGLPGVAFQTRQSADWKTAPPPGKLRRSASRGRWRGIEALDSSGHHSDIDESARLDRFPKLRKHVRSSVM